MRSLVSIVIPVYNTKEYLEECVQSVITQTYQNFEVLLVDDGSTDGSSDFCDELSGRDDRIRVIHKANGGAATARNMGIETATGKYIMFLDSDDWLSEDAVATLVMHAEEHNTDVIRFNYVREFKEKQLIKRNTFMEERVYVGEECKAVCRQILGLTGKELAHPENMNFLASCGFNMYKTSLLLESGARFIPIQETGSFVDGLFNFHVFMNVKRFEYIDRHYYHYRKTNEGAATAGYRRNYIERQIVLFEKLKSIINQAHEWDYYKEALNNRIVLSTMEIAFNALRNKTSVWAKYREISYALKHERFKEAYQTFNLEHLDLKWSVYYFFITHSMVVPTYLMTAIMLKLKNRGVK